MNKILKRLLTGVLTLATVFTALPTTAVHAAETQYWTESEERVGIVEKVMNDGSIGSTFNEGHMTVEGEDAYCIDINTGFKNGYKTRSDASTRMTADQIEDVALSLEYVKQYTKSHTGLSSQHAYLLRQLVVWQRLSVHLGWSCDNVRASYDEISKSVQDEVFAGAKAFVRENKGRYDCYGYIYTGEGQDLGQFFAELAVGNGKIQKSSSNTTVTTVIDTVTLDGLEKGTTYQLKGWQMVKSENAQLLIGGEPVESDYTFTAKDSSMEVQIAFTFNASELAGKDLVTFEELYDLSNPDEPTKVAEHKDIEDEGQTVTITERIITMHTIATDKATGEKTIEVDDKVTQISQFDLTLEKDSNWKIVK